MRFVFAFVFMAPTVGMTSDLVKYANEVVARTIKWNGINLNLEWRTSINRTIVLKLFYVFLRLVFDLRGQSPSTLIIRDWPLLMLKFKVESSPSQRQ